MGKFLKYEDSNFRTFVIDVVNRTVTRPKRKITKEDLLGAVVEVKAGDENNQTIICCVGDVEDGIEFILSAKLINGIAKYSPAKDTFEIITRGPNGDTNTTGEMTNIFIDSFGREERYV